MAARLPLRWGDAQRANFAVFMLNTTDSSVVTLISVYLDSRGYSVAEIGLLVSAYAVASLASRIPAGRAADGRHARGWFILSCGLQALAVAAYPFAPVVWAVVLVRLAHGLASGTAATLNLAAFLGVAAGPNRAQTTALYTAAMSAGYTLGNFMAGTVADTFGYTTAFLLAALFPAAAVFAGVRPQPGPASAAVPGTPGGSGAPPALGLRALLSRREVRAVPLLGFCISMTHTTVGTLFPLYMLSIGQSLSAIGIARSFQSLANTVIRPFGAPLLRIFGVVGLACVGLAVHALSSVSIPLFTAPVVLIGVFIVMGAGRGFGIVASHLATSELTSRNAIKRGTASSLVSLGQDCAAIIAPTIAGFVAARVGVGLALQVIPIFGASVGIFVMLQARAGFRSGHPGPTRPEAPQPGGARPVTSS